MHPCGKLSAYANALPAASRVRYAEKIKVINYVDPYDARLNTTDFPTTVTTGHVVHYLLNHVASSSGNHLKSIKSIEAYKKFESGFVTNVAGGIINNLFVVRGRVSHSMKLNAPPLNAWIILKTDGFVESAHCNCIAGLSETCSHISTLLYALANLHFMTTTYKLSVTELPSYWARPAKKMTEDLYHPVREIEYGYKITRMDDIVVQTDRNDFLNLMVELQKMGSDAAVLRKFCDGDERMCTGCHENWVPDEFFQSKNVLLQNLFKPELENADYEDVWLEAQHISIELSENEMQEIERLTRQQSLSDFWRFVRTGRITASLMSECIHASTSVVPKKMTLLKKICHPELAHFTSEAVVYGRDSEPKAKKSFSIRVKDHKNVQLSECGIFVYRDQSYIAATPDLIMSCDCCGRVPVEIKCPFRLKGKTQLNQQLTLDICAEGNNAFLEKHDGGFRLSTKHAYFMQIQAQIFITNAEFGWFFVWSNCDTIAIKVDKDPTFWRDACQKAEIYFKNIVLPELLANHFINKTK